MVSTAILALVLSPLFIMQSTSLHQARSSIQSFYGSALARELADQLRLLPFSNLPIQDPLEFEINPESETPIILPGSIPLLIGSYPFSAKISILLEPLDPPDMLGRVSILVRWEEGLTRMQKEHRHVELIENRGVVKPDEL